MHLSGVRVGPVQVRACDPLHHLQEPTMRLQDIAHVQNVLENFLKAMRADSPRSQLQAENVQTLRKNFLVQKNITSARRTRQLHDPRLPL